MKVLRKIASSCSSSAETFKPAGLRPLLPKNEYSLNVNESGPIPC